MCNLSLQNTENVQIKYLTFLMINILIEGLMVRDTFFVDFGANIIFKKSSNTKFRIKNCIFFWTNFFRAIYYQPYITRRRNFCDFHLSMTISI